MDNVNVHTKKFYRVVLEGIDRSIETAETFAVKMTLRLRMTTPRAKLVARNLPCILRSNLSATEANRLKAVIEDIGGQCRLETHFVTPGEGREAVPPLDDMRAPESSARPEGTFKCPSCGSEEDPAAEYCSMCLRRFRVAGQRTSGLGSRIPHDNPLEGSVFRPTDAEAIRNAWRNYKWLIVAAVGLLFLLVLIIK